MWEEGNLNTPILERGSKIGPSGKARLGDVIGSTHL